MVRALSFSCLPLTLAALLGGCGRASEVEPSPRVNDGVTLLPALGQLRETVEEYQTSRHVEDCDRQYADLARQISLELDRRAPEISELQRQDALDRTGDETRANATRSFGPITLERSAPPAANLSEEWTIKTRGWPEIARTYARVRDQPTNSDWVDFASRFQYLLSDDGHRLVDRRNYGLNHEAPPKIAALRAPLANCVEAPRCVSPSFSSAHLTFIRSVPMYADYLRRLNLTSRSLRQRRETLRAFRTRVQRDYDRWSFSPYSLARQTRARHWDFPMYFGDLEEDAIQIFKEVVQQIWATDTYQIEVRPVRAISRVFHFLLFPQEFGGRNHITREPPEMRIYPGASELTLAHEFGHVIGFRDQYFTLWDAQVCSYTIETQPADLMSASRTGRVLPKHWLEIVTHYPR